MFRTSTLTVLLFCACAGMSYVAARPSYLPPATAVETVEYTPTVIGHTVHALPAAVSHQSQTIVHEKRPYLRPIVKHHTPIVKTYATPTIVSAYSPISTAYDWPLAHGTAALSPLAAYPAYSGLYDYGWSPSVGSIASIGGIYSGWNGWPLK